MAPGTACSVSRGRTKATIAERAAEQIAAAKLGELLDARERISVAEYEHIMKLPPSAPLAVSHRTANKEVRFVGVINQLRQDAPG